MFIATHLAIAWSVDPVITRDLGYVFNVNLQPTRFALFVRVLWTVPNVKMVIELIAADCVKNAIHNVFSATTPTIVLTVSNLCTSQRHSPARSVSIHAKAVTPRLTAILVFQDFTYPQLAYVRIALPLVFLAIRHPIVNRVMLDTILILLMIPAFFVVYWWLIVDNATKLLVLCASQIIYWMRELVWNVTH